MPTAALARTDASVALRTTSGSRRRSSPFSSIRSKACRRHKGIRRHHSGASGYDCLEVMSVPAISCLPRCVPSLPSISSATRPPSLTRRAPCQRAVESVEFLESILFQRSDRLRSARTAVGSVGHRCRRPVLLKNNSGCTKPFRRNLSKYATAFAHDECSLIERPATHCAKYTRRIGTAQSLARFS